VVHTFERFNVLEILKISVFGHARIPLNMLNMLKLLVICLSVSCWCETPGCYSRSLYQKSIRKYSDSYLTVKL
jgi:hypothetical protein